MLVNGYGILILGLYIVLSANGPSKGQSFFTYFPYIIILVVVINILTGLVFVIVHFKIRIVNSKTQ